MSKHGTDDFIGIIDDEPLTSPILLKVKISIWTDAFYIKSYYQ